MSRPISWAELDRRFLALIVRLSEDDRATLRARARAIGDWRIQSKEVHDRFLDMLVELSRPAARASKDWIEGMFADPFYHHKFAIGQLRREGFSTPGKIMIQLKARHPELAKDLNSNTVKV